VVVCYSLPLRFISRYSLLLYSPTFHVLRGRELNFCIFGKCNRLQMRTYNNKYIILYLEMIVARRVFHPISGIMVLWLELLPLSLPVAMYQSVKTVKSIINQLSYGIKKRKNFDELAENISIYLLRKFLYSQSN